MYTIERATKEFPRECEVVWKHDSRITGKVHGYADSPTGEALLMVSFDMPVTRQINGVPAGTAYVAVFHPSTVKRTEPDSGKLTLDDMTEDMAKLMGFGARAHAMNAVRKYAKDAASGIPARYAHAAVWTDVPMAVVMQAARYRDFGASPTT